jgi:hypothetical protein
MIKLIISTISIFAASSLVAAPSYDLFNSQATAHAEHLKILSEMESAARELVDNAYRKIPGAKSEWIKMLDVTIKNPNLFVFTYDSLNYRQTYTLTPELTKEQCLRFSKEFLNSQSIYEPNGDSFKAYLAAPFAATKSPSKVKKLGSTDFFIPMSEMKSGARCFSYPNGTFQIAFYMGIT